MAGGRVENRLRYPLEIFDAVREVWPAERPILVRISATDWSDGGNTVSEAVTIATAFLDRGADGIDVSSGQVVGTGKASVRSQLPVPVRRSNPQ